VTLSGDCVSNPLYDRCPHSMSLQILDTSPNGRFESDVYSLLTAGIFPSAFSILRGNVQGYRVVFCIALLCVESVDQMLS
jgi:hypothetical protein